MAIQEEVTIEVGQAVDVSLESMMGSTGYSWELTSLEGGVNLAGISVQPTSTRPVAPVTHRARFPVTSIQEKNQNGEQE